MKFRLKRIAAFTLVFVMLMFNINMTVTADTSSSVTITSISTGTAIHGHHFRVDVTVTNHTSWRIENVSVAETFSSPSVMIASATESLTQSIDGHSSATFSFYYNAVNATAHPLSAQIRFAVNVSGSAAHSSETTILVHPVFEQPEPPEPPAPTHRFDIAAEMYIPHTREAAVGDNIRMGFRIINSGLQSFNVQAAIHRDNNGVPGGVISASDDTGFLPTSPALISIGNMQAEESAFLDFAFDVTNEAANGQNRLWLVITAAGDRRREHPINFTLDVPQIPREELLPNLRFTNVVIPPTAERGDRFTLYATVENTGADAYDVSASITRSAGIGGLATDNIQIGTLRTGERRDISFDLIVRPNAPDHWNEITLTASGENTEGTTAQATYGTGVIVPEADIAVYDLSITNVTIPANVEAGANFDVTVTIENTGAEARNVNLNLAAQNGLLNMSQNPIIISSIGENETITRTFTFTAPSADQPRFAAINITLTIGEHTVSQNTGLHVLAEVPEVSDLSITTVTIPQSVNEGSRFAVEITAANTGESELRNVRLSVASPQGVTEQGSQEVTLRSLAPGETHTMRVEYVVSPQAAPGFLAFAATLAATDVETVTRNFGTVLNAPGQSNLRIDRVSAPTSVRVNYDMDAEFTVEVVVTNAGAAEARDVTLRLAPENPAALAGTSQNPMPISRIGPGESVTRSFTFMARRTAPEGFTGIEATLTDGEQSVSLPSGTNIINPPREDGSDDPTSQGMPVVIVNHFSFEVVTPDSPPEQNIGGNFGGDFGMPPSQDRPMTRDFDDFGGFDGLSGFDDLDDFGNFDGTDEFGDFNEFDEFGNDIFEQTRTVVVEGGDRMVVGRPMPPIGGMPGGMDGGMPSGPPANPVIDTDAVLAGNSFIFTVELLNTHRSVSVRDLTVRIDSEVVPQVGAVFTPARGSNTFFIEYLGPRETTEVQIELVASADTPPGSHEITVNMRYTDEERTGVVPNETVPINIPVRQELRFSIMDIPFIEEVDLGDEAFVRVTFGNSGRSVIHNAMVRVVGEGFFDMDGGFFHAGNLNPGAAFTSHNFFLTTTMPGWLSGNFIFTYEDTDGNVFEEWRPFGFIVAGDMGDGGMFPGDDFGFGFDEYGREIIGWDFDEVTGEMIPVIAGVDIDDEDGDGIPLGLIIAIAGGIIVIAAIVIIVVVVRKNRASDVDDDEDDSDNDDNEYSEDE